MSIYIVCKFNILEVFLTVDIMIIEFNKYFNYTSKYIIDRVNQTVKKVRICRNKS